MPKQKTSAPQKIYRLKITLRDTRPPIWRRVEVADTATLHGLHRVIQGAMGWTNSHLHEFEIEGESYSEPEFGLDDAGDRGVKNERRVELARLALRPKQKFTYEYDFGDDWRHEILVERISEPEAGALYPRCLAGKRSCPPEDCGGVWGYANFLEAIKDEDHLEHEEMLEWVGERFDPEAFDLEEVNEVLAEL